MEAVAALAAIVLGALIVVRLSGGRVWTSRAAPAYSCLLISALVLLGLIGLGLLFAGVWTLDMGDGESERDVGVSLLLLGALVVGGAFFALLRWLFG